MGLPYDKAISLANRQEIARLRAELEDVKAAYDQMNDAFIADGDIIAEQRSRAEAAETRLSEMEKEVGRLRGALKRAETRLSQVDCANIGMMHNTSPVELLDWCKSVAAAGLSEIYEALNPVKRG